MIKESSQSTCIQRMVIYVLICLLINLLTINTYSQITEEIPPWCEKEVAHVRKLNIMIGYPDGEFKDDRIITRYEHLVVLGRIFDITANIEKQRIISPLNLLQTHWAYNPIKWYLSSTDYYIELSPPFMHPSEKEIIINLYEVIKKIEERKEEGIKRSELKVNKYTDEYYLICKDELTKRGILKEDELKVIIRDKDNGYLIRYQVAIIISSTLDYLAKITGNFMLEKKSP